MTEGFTRSLPPCNDDVRREIYSGRIYLLPSVAESRALANRVLQEIHDALGDDFRRYQFSVSDDEFFARIGKLRKMIYTRTEYHALVDQLIDALGFRLADHAYDPARLRVVAHGGDRNEAAAPVYYGHRDTWYSNSQAMITWWIPLHDIRPEESFEFYPEDFARVVRNNSEVFDFDRWVARGQDNRIGWQNKETGLTAQYPELGEAPRGRRVPVEAAAGDILLFSAQHLHQTRRNRTGQTRFSLDFRTVHVSDHDQNRGAVNVDNRSTGSSLVQFVRPDDREALP